MAAEIIRKRAGTLQVGDVVQHPVFGARWLTIEWLGKDTDAGEISVGGYYQSVVYQAIQREAFRIKLKDTVATARQRKRQREEVANGNPVPMG